MLARPPPSVVLVRPREEGNVGAVARAMVNMGLGELTLVEPAPALGGVARGFGVGAWEVLDGCRRVGDLAAAIAPYARVVGTSSGRERPLPRRRVLTPRRLPGVLAGDPPGTATVLVFGPETSGLTREELDLCNLVVTIPCAPEHPTLNLAQAVLVLAYELRVAAQPAARGPAVEPALATAAEVGDLLADAGRLLRRVGFDHDHIHAGLLRDLRRLAGRSGMTGIESRILRRVVNRILHRLDSAAAGDGE